jgi:hypothetical protein
MIDIAREPGPVREQLLDCHLCEPCIGWLAVSGKELPQGGRERRIEREFAVADKCRGARAGNRLRQARKVDCRIRISPPDCRSIDDSSPAAHGNEGLLHTVLCCPILQCHAEGLRCVERRIYRQSCERKK